VIGAFATLTEAVSPTGRLVRSVGRLHIRDREWKRNPDRWSTIVALGWRALVVSTIARWRTTPPRSATKAP